MGAHSSFFQTKEESISMGGVIVKYLSVLNKDELFNNLIEKGQNHEDVVDERMPYWCELWPSAIALSEFLTQNKKLVENKTVIEIGCGLGLTGMVASILGASVTMTDYLDEPLEFAKKNASLNQINNIQFKKMDWRKPDSSLAADVLLASDVAYEKRSFNHLIIAFEKLVKAGGMILLSEPNRKFAASFFEMLKTENFSCQIFDFMINQNNFSQLVKVYRLAKL